MHSTVVKGSIACQRIKQHMYCIHNIVTIFGKQRFNQLYNLVVRNVIMDRKIAIVVHHLKTSENTIFKYLNNIILMKHILIQRWMSLYIAP